MILASNMAKKIHKTSLGPYFASVASRSEPTSVLISTLEAWVNMSFSHVILCRCFGFPPPLEMATDKVDRYQGKTPFYVLVHIEKIDWFTWYKSRCRWVTWCNSFGRQVALEKLPQLWQNLHMCIFWRCTCRTATKPKLWQRHPSRWALEQQLLFPWILV